MMRFATRLNAKQLLEQDEIWYLTDHVPIRLDEMSPEHRANTLAMLLRQAGYRRMLVTKIECLTSLHMPDDVYDEIEQRLVQRTLEESAQSWMARQPLVVRLQQMVNDDRIRSGDIVDGEVITERKEIERG